MMSGSVVRVEQPDEAIAILMLNRPERRNALTMELMQSLCRTLKSLAAEPRRRVVILGGMGEAFCAGLDLHEAAESERFEESAHWVAETFQMLATSPLVTIAAAHGAAYAGGAGLMGSCDLVLATADLRICFSEVRRGLVPALAVAAVRGRLREGNLRELVLLSEPIDAGRALAIGLVDRIVPADQLRSESLQLAASVLKGAPNAVRQTKQLLRELRATDPSERFSRALEFHKRARRSEEAEEGLTAFHQRRLPRWRAGVE
jgi:methylglutaconyl-CoA hydratase